MWVRNSKGNVFVGNLPPDFPDERLAEAFDPFGIVLTARVARDPDTGARLRYGFVDIATERAATKAIDALHGTEIDGCKLNVKASEKKPKAANGKAPGGKPGARRPAPRPAPRRILVAEESGLVAEESGARRSSRRRAATSRSWSDRCGARRRASR